MGPAIGSAPSSKKEEQEERAECDQTFEHVAERAKVGPDRREGHGEGEEEELHENRLVPATYKGSAAGQRTDQLRCSAKGGEEGGGGEG
jgi:hypothetical protein